MNRSNFPERKRAKKTDAAKRQDFYNQLSLEEKVARLAQRPGNNTKERAKLDKQIKLRDELKKSEKHDGTKS